MQDTGLVAKMGGQTRISEDCLYLNVWTGAKKANEKRPVMVWIYGGAFVGGTTSFPTFDGAKAIGEIIQKPVVYQSVDAQTLVRILKDAGRDERAAGFVAALDSNIAAGLLAEVTGHLSALIGRPTTPLKKGFADALLA